MKKNLKNYIKQTGCKSLCEIFGLSDQYMRKLANWPASTSKKRFDQVKVEVVVEIENGRPVRIIKTETVTIEAKQ
jgi:hypothetical protein